MILYIPNAAKPYFWTTPMNNFTAIAAVIKLRKFPIAISDTAEELRVSQFLSILYPAAAERVGTAKKKENSVADCFESLQPKAPAMLAALRLVPGIMAKD